MTNQEVDRFSTLDDAAIAYKLQQYGDVLLQIGVNPRALAGAERILAHLTFEQQYREGFYDDAIAKYRAKEAAAANDTDFVPEETPPGLVTW